MAQGVALKNGTTFYAINLASHEEHINATTTRIHWTCNIQFGNWYQWGVRLHVAVDGVEVGWWDGACSHRGQVVINVGGSRDIGRADGGRSVKVEAWSESRTVNGYGGVGVTTSCSEWRSVPAIPYQVPNPPSDMTAWRNSDRQNGMSWRNNPDGVVKKYTQLKVTRTVDGGDWHELKVLNPDAKGSLPTSFTDNDVYANHRYRYAVRAANNAGWTVASHSGYVYTTPSAPSECGASRSSDTQARVWWKLGARASSTYLNVLLERRTDEGGWVQIATLGAATTNYTDNGVSENHRYDYRVRAYNGLYSGYSTQNGYVYTTPAAPKSVSLAKIGGTRVRISIEAASPWADSYLYQLSLNGGGWSAEKSMGTSIEVDAGGGSVRARVRAKKGDMYSGYRESGTVTTVVPPNAPTLSEFANVYALPATVRVSWAKAHPDGSAQTAAQVEVTDPNGHTSVVEVTTESHADVSATVEGDHLVRVRTKGLDPSWGAWSPQGTFHAENAPTAHFVTPSSDGEVIDLIPFVATWDIVTSSGVSSQEIRLLTETGDVLHSAQLPVDARSYSFSVDTYLPQNERKYIVQLTALDGYSLVAQAKRLISTNYAEPAEPKVSVTNVLGDLSARIVVYKGEGDSPESLLTVVPTVRLSVARMLDDGSQEMLIDDLASGNEVIDRLPPLNVDYTYLVTAYSDAGTATTVEVPAHMASDGCEAFNFGADASRALLLRLDTASDSTVSHGGEWFNFALGPSAPGLPTFYPDGSMSASGSHSYVVLDEGEYKRIDSLRRQRGGCVCWYRDCWGLRYRVKADWKLSYSAARYMQWGVSVNVTEAVWEAPING